MKALKHNYQANINILKENLKRGLEPSQAIKVIDSWRSQFVSHDLYGDDEREFINQALDAVSAYTGMTVKEVA